MKQTTVKLHCPRCDGDSIAAVETIEVLTRVTDATRKEDGTLDVEYGAPEYLLETATPVDPAKPFCCRRCLANLSLDELKVVEG